MIDLLKHRYERFQEIESLIQDAAVIADSARYAELLKERGKLEEPAKLYQDYLKLQSAIQDDEEILQDPDNEPEILELAREELEELKEQLALHQEKVQEVLLLDDELSSRSCILEIRAGTGGDEASLFANDLFTLYERFCSREGLKVELMDRVDSEMGGLKSIVFRVKGEDATKKLRYEGGTHRVQRVPVTESQGRVHTSAATVAVLPEPETIEIDINPGDLEVSAARSGGPGGQNVNKVASKCILLHKPSGIQVMCQETKSFHQNRDRAMDLLRAKLYEQERLRIEGERSAARASMIGSGDRSEKIRTYNWPQNRCTDHRCKVNMNLDQVLMGNLQDIIQGMRKLEVTQRLQELEKALPE